MYRFRRRPRPVRLVLEPLEPRDVPGFLAPVSYVVGKTPYDVATADVNGDGRLDVVVVDYGDTNVAVLIGNGDGTLQSPVYYATGKQPLGVAVGDLNGDGKPDIVTGNSYYPVSVLLNNGDGTFGPEHGYGGQPGGSHRAAIGDVDGDHVPDVVVSDWNDNGVYVYHGNGDGSLADPKVYNMPFWYSWNVHIADLDGDGVGDITADQPNTLTVIYSSGAVVTYASGGGSLSHAVGDVNRDGWPDVIVGQAFGRAPVRVMFNRGDGTLLPPVEVHMGPGFYPLVADFNRDRKPDIAAQFSASMVSVVLGNGDGTFKPPSTYAATQGDAQVA